MYQRCHGVLICSRANEIALQVIKQVPVATRDSMQGGNSARNNPGESPSVGEIKAIQEWLLWVFLKV